MASIDYATLTAPIDGTAPCGPDLDFEGDPDFMNYVARAEGLLPAAYIVLHPKGGGYVVFDRLSNHIPIPYPEEIAAIADLLARSRDLRLLSLLAKFHILNRDISGFAQTIDATARLVVERWDEVHPGADGDFGLRSVVLEGLDDAATVVQPLLHAPLLTSRRFGPLSQRNIMVRRGEGTAREEEEVPDEATIEDAFEKVDFAELVRRRDEIARVKAGLAQIRATWLAKAGHGQAIAFTKLAPAVDAILKTVDEAVGRRDPGARLTAAEAERPEAEAESGEAAEVRAAPAAAGKIGSVAEAAEALAAAAGYYAKHEPSSPALLLTRQAQSLMGKSFHEVIEALLPNQAEQASIRFGVDAVFDLPIQRLSGLNGADAPSSWDETPAEPEPEAESDGWGSAEPAAESEEDAAAPAPAARPVPNGTARRIGPAQTRQEAISLLQQVGSFYRASEPASPIPLFTERACGLSQKDFLTLLKDVLPGLKVTVSE